MFRPPRSPTRLEGDTAPSCRSIARVVEAYLDGECDSETAMKVVAHLEACKPCSDESRALEEIKRSLATGRCCGTDPDVVASLRAYAKRLSQG